MALDTLLLWFYRSRTAPEASVRDPGNRHDAAIRNEKARTNGRPWPDHEQLGPSAKNLLRRACRTTKSSDFGTSSIGLQLLFRAHRYRGEDTGGRVMNDLGG